MSLAIAIGYAFLIMKYLDGWNETEVHSSLGEDFQTKVSIIVAVFNEEQHIQKCIQSILDCDYPKSKFELIVVDNASTDNTREILDNFDHSCLTVLNQEEGHKKESLELGISHAKNPFLLFTDGDCVVRKDWIKTMVFPHEVLQAQCVLGPVEILRYNNLLTRFQAFDMLALMGVTCGGLKKEVTYLANGANFGYTQNLFSKLQAIPRKDLASGDDVFVLHEYVRSGGKQVFFQKHEGAIVGTAAQRTWKDLVQQRIRWASKATSYVKKQDVFINAFVFLFCVSIAVNIVLVPITGGLSLFIAVFQLFIKAIIDYAFIDHVNKIFKKKHLMKYFLSSFAVHYFYILGSGLSGLLGLSYRWKGKKLR